MNFFFEVWRYVETGVACLDNIVIDIDDFVLDDVKVLLLNRKANEMILHFSGKVSIDEVVRLKTNLIELFNALHLKRYNLNQYNSHIIYQAFRV